MIKIIDPGLYSSTQDNGRHNYQKYGVPISGCMDLKASYFANALLNNSKNAALIEATQLGPKILFSPYLFKAKTNLDNVSDLISVSLFNKK